MTNKLTQEQISTMSVDQILEQFPSKSAAIRYMSSELDMKRGQIAKVLNIRYQHVRNVLITPLKKDQNK